MTPQTWQPNPSDPIHVTAAKAGALIHAIDELEPPDDPQELERLLTIWEDVAAWADAAQRYLLVDQVVAKHMPVGGVRSSATHRADDARRVLGLLETGSGVTYPKSRHRDVSRPRWM